MLYIFKVKPSIFYTIILIDPVERPKLAANTRVIALILLLK